MALSNHGASESRNLPRHRVERVEISFVSNLRAERSSVRPVSTLPTFQLFHQSLKNFFGETRQNCELLPPIRYQTTLQHLRFIVSESRPGRSSATLISAESQHSALLLVQLVLRSLCGLSSFGLRSYKVFCQFSEVLWFLMFFKSS